MIKQVYLASPFSHKSKLMMKARFEEINKIAADLHLKYPHAFICPITCSATLKKYQPKLIGTDFAYWAARDLKFIDTSEELWVVTMESWQDSVGVTAEIQHAKATNKPVFYVDPETLKKTKHPKS